jgi:hypothetical protein
MGAAEAAVSRVKIQTVPGRDVHFRLFVNIPSSSRQLKHKQYQLTACLRYMARHFKTETK